MRRGGASSLIGRPVPHRPATASSCRFESAWVVCGRYARHMGAGGANDELKVTTRRIAWLLAGLAAATVLLPLTSTGFWADPARGVLALGTFATYVWPVPVAYLIAGGAALDHVTRRAGRWINLGVHVVGVCVVFVVLLSIGTRGAVMAGPIILVPAATGYELFFVPVVGLVAAFAVGLLMNVRGSFPHRRQVDGD